jgi:hypothetical protein
VDQNVILGKQNCRKAVFLTDTVFNNTLFSAFHGNQIHHYKCTFHWQEQTQSSEQCLEPTARFGWKVGERVTGETYGTLGYFQDEQCQKNFFISPLPVLWLLPTVPNKGTGFPLQAWACPWGSGWLRLRIFSTISTMKVVRSSPLRTGRLCPHEFPGTFFRGWVDPKAYGSVGSFEKNPQQHHWGQIPRPYN